MVAMMDTLAIYEQFRSTLGEERARVFAQTLGTMIEEAKNAATKDDIRLLRETLDASTSRLETAMEKLAEAQVRTEERLDRLEQAVEKLAEAQVRMEGRLDRLEQTVEKLAEALVRAEGRLDRLEQAVEKLAEALVRAEGRLDRLEQAVEKLAEAQVRTEERLDRLEQAVEKMVLAIEKQTARGDRHEGTLLELKFRDRLPSYLGLFLRRAKVLQPADLLEEVEPRLERSEVEDFLRSDVVARGTVDGAATYVVGEVSYTADADDVERAARRAALLRKASLPAIGLVACETVQPQTLAYAREQGVRVWADGRFVDEQPAKVG